RSKTVDTAKYLHKFLQEKKTPPAHKEKKCDTCSLSGICLPKIGNGDYSVADYVKEIVSE
ncbi:MAG: Dna2/Cas4 domain-containing protein, partial [Endomicrobiia bacterium]|nr:Dna2/Cas4 domain-containing protein [Endomicrobiia bacterium]